MAIIPTEPRRRIFWLLRRKNLAVIMPSGDNSFYVNSPILNNHYGEFIRKELVYVTRRMRNEKF